MTATHPLRLLLVDDVAAAREALRWLFEGDPTLEVVGEAADGVEAVAQAQRVAPDVVLMDLAMAGMDGAEATRCLRALCPAAQVLIFTGFGDGPRVSAALAAGAVGLVRKDALAGELQRAIHAAARGLTPSARLAGQGG